MKRGERPRSDSEAASSSNSSSSSKIRKIEDVDHPWPSVVFHEKLCGSGDNLKPIKSLHTHRILKPYIRQDYDTEPSKLKLIREINQRGSKEPIPKSPINYTYIQAKHVPQINRLASEFFWPGIDGKFHVLFCGTYIQ